MGVGLGVDQQVKSHCFYFKTLTQNVFYIALAFIGSDSDRNNVIKNFKLPEENMLMWNFDKRSALVPNYYIIRDPKSKALCIVIRGTFVSTSFSLSGYLMFSSFYCHRVVTE
jgi:hypothetical protein